MSAQLKIFMAAILLIALSCSKDKSTSSNQEQPPETKYSVTVINSSSNALKFVINSVTRELGAGQRIVIGSWVRNVYDYHGEYYNYSNSRWFPFGNGQIDLNHDMIATMHGANGLFSISWQ